MPLQNRVDPLGAIHAVTQRGLFTGNRGVIHDPATRTLLGRHWTTKTWIICDLVHPRGARRAPMGRNAPSGRAGWTELFFLDEVTALAAGHRPCFYCRRESAVEFARCFAQGQERKAISAPEMDAALHATRLASGGGARRLDVGAIAALPDGAAVSFKEGVFARHGGRWLRWAFDGWRLQSPPTTDALLVTPPATVAALQLGYAPVWRPSATL